VGRWRVATLVPRRTAANGPEAPAPAARRHTVGGVLASALGWQTARTGRAPGSRR